jgi:hypothetical protein
MNEKIITWDDYCQLIGYCLKDGYGDCTCLPPYTCCRNYGNKNKYFKINGHNVYWADGIVRHWYNKGSNEMCVYYDIEKKKYFIGKMLTKRMIEIIKIGSEENPATLEQIDDLKSERTMTLSKDFVLIMASNLTNTIKHYRTITEKERRKMIDLESELENVKSDFNKHMLRQIEIEEAAGALINFIRKDFCGLLIYEDVELLIDTLALGKIE